MSPTARTLLEMKKRGYPLVQVVERYNPYAKRRIDLFGIIDVVCCNETEIVGIQATSGDNVSKRIDKINESAAIAVLRKAGVRVLVHGWRKNSKGRYVLREVDLS